MLGRGGTDSPCFVWDKTASGTARSNTGNGLHLWNTSKLCKDEHCLVYFSLHDSQNGLQFLPLTDCQRVLQLFMILLLAVSEVVLSHTESSSRSALQSINIELLAVPEEVLSHIESRSWSAVQSILCVAPCCPRGSYVPYKSKEQIIFAVHSLLLYDVPEAVLSHKKARSISSVGLSLQK